MRLQLHRNSVRENARCLHANHVPRVWGVHMATTLCECEVFTVLATGATLTWVDSLYCAFGGGDLVPFRGGDVVPFGGGDLVPFGGDLVPFGGDLVLFGEDLVPLLPLGSPPKLWYWVVGDLGPAKCPDVLDHSRDFVKDGSFGEVGLLGWTGVKKQSFNASNSAHRWEQHTHEVYIVCYVCKQGQ